MLELSLNTPVHVAADRLHKVEGGWSSQGLSLVPDTRKEASATFTYQAANLDRHGRRHRAPPASTRRWPGSLPLPLDELRKAIDDINTKGTKDEKIFALSLDYVAKNLDPKEAGAS